MYWTAILGVVAVLLPILVLYALRTYPAIRSVQRVVDQVEGEARARVKAALRLSRVCGFLSASCEVLAILSLILVFRVGWWWKPLCALAGWAVWQLYRGFAGGMHLNLREAKALVVEPEIENPSQGSEATSLPLFLYLRPFDLDLNLQEKWTELGDQGSILTYVRHLEDLLEDAYAKEARWVALGDPRAKSGIGIGRGRVSDEEWREAFVCLASKASRIFVIPSHRGGGLNEVRWLVRNAKLESCVFIRPGSSGASANWLQSSKILQRLGISLPPDGLWGIFTVNRNGKASRVLPLPFNDTAKARLQFDMLEQWRFADAGAQERAGSPASPTVERQTWRSFWT
jgi:GNAT superfamily N-acetyltransferase